MRFPKMSEAAKLRWVERRKKLEPKQRKIRLDKDLKLLARVMKGIRSKLEFPERNRKRALRDYHRNSDRINDLRRFPGVYRTALRRQASREREQQSLLRGLEVAIRRVDARSQVKERSLVTRALRRRFNKGMDQRSAPHQKSDYIFRLCGAPLMEVVRHLESLFKPGMSWDNYGFEGWHIDHIKPLAKFNILDPEEQKKCFHYSNLQPLWSSENLAKRVK